MLFYLNKDFISKEQLFYSFEKEINTFKRDIESVIYRENILK